MAITSLAQSIRHRTVIPTCKSLYGKLKARRVKLQIHINVRTTGRVFYGYQNSYLRTLLHLTKNLCLSYFKKVDTVSLLYTMEAADIHNLNFDMSPPPHVKGMTVFARDAFRKTITPAGILVPKEKMQSVLKVVRKIRFKGIKTHELLKDDPLSLTHKVLLFDPSVVKHFEDLKEDLKTEMTGLGVDLKTFGHFNMELQYENWNMSQILNAVLPDNVSNIRGFSTVGHIAQLNLRDEALPYKNLIGQVVLDKTPKVLTVINKASEIDNEFRTLQMELIAGEENFITTVKENGCSFSFDFSKVYWNTKLGTEHQRILDRISEGDIVFDVFAGVGPFAIPAAKKGAIVYANDLNPDSYSSLHDSARKVRKKKGKINCYNLDGREFIQTIVKDELLGRWKGKKRCRPANVHIIMNLPSIAIEFLDAIVHLFAPEDISPSRMKDDIYVYCYCFSKEDEVEEDARKRVEEVLKQTLPENHKIRIVRNVAPKKEMLCVRFELTPNLLFGENLEAEPPAEKKMRVEDSP